MTTWRPSPEPTGYAPQRVAKLAPLEAAIKGLGLPMLRVRKLNGILNALTMQVEDGGDAPEVNQLLLDALRAAVLHQAGKVKGAGVLRAIETVQQEEKQRWEKERARTMGQQK